MVSFEQSTSMAQAACTDSIRAVHSTSKKINGLHEGYEVARTFFSVILTKDVAEEEQAAS